MRTTLIDLYADVRAPLLHLPHYSVNSFAERLDRHGTEIGFMAAIGFDGDEPVGYAYANTLTEDDRWWKRMDEPLPQGFTSVSTVALKEIGVREPWRGTGSAVQIHDALLAQRTEQRVTLLVNPLAGNGKVQAVYERWGYATFNRQQPSPGSAAVVAMIRDREAKLR
ncbi:MAG TPA: hypothetical protein VL551_13765 [Actinospica sp.]|nr:hypothetical protein [Actinospica sp.]